MKVNVLRPDLNKVTVEALAVGVFQGDGKKSALFKKVDDLTEGSVARFFSKNPKFGKIFDSAAFHIAPNKHKNLEKVVFIGLGKKDKFDTYRLRQVAGAIGKHHTKNVNSAAVYFEGGIYGAEIIVVGFSSGIFDPGHHKTNDNGQSEKSKVESLEILVSGDLKKAEEEARRGLVIAEAIHKAREVVNLPANTVTPQYMVKWARKIAEENKLKIEVFSEKQVNAMGMGIMASVAKGSEEDLYFVIMKYLHPQAKKTLALVGKGITFDSGGISLKPGDSMEWMKMDMAGAASVFGALEVISKLKPKINVIAACPLTENLPSGRASKPGDVVKGLGGKTVEIINTDAEGRLVLADAITYVQKNFKPDYIVDAATLTGASIVALGNWASAVLGRPQSFIDSVRDAASGAGERVWQLPLYDEYRDQLKSYIADIGNVSSTRGGGTETGAKFIEEFVDEKVSWAHLDIAPNAWEESEKPYASKGATGIPLLTLVNLAEILSQSK